MAKLGVVVIATSGALEHVCWGNLNLACTFPVLGSSSLGLYLMGTEPEQEARAAKRQRQRAEKLQSGIYASKVKLGKNHL